MSRWSHGARRRSPEQTLAPARESNLRARRDRTPAPNGLALRRQARPPPQRLVARARSTQSLRSLQTLTLAGSQSPVPLRQGESVLGPAARRRRRRLSRSVRPAAGPPRHPQSMRPAENSAPTPSRGRTGGARRRSHVDPQTPVARGPASTRPHRRSPSPPSLQTRPRFPRPQPQRRRLASARHPWSLLPSGRRGPARAGEFCL